MQSGSVGVAGRHAGVHPGLRPDGSFLESWNPQFSEDAPERGPGPALVDYLGIPINDAARQWALSWDPDRLTLQEHQCQVHTVAYIYRGPLLLRIWEERDPQTQELVAIHNYISNYEQSRSIWMDGRPHPPDYAPHTWMGFSTGHWDGNILTVITTHVKQGWHRRNGIPSSDLITLTEHFIRHGDHMTHVTVVDDPVYLAEPLVKSQDYILNTNSNPTGNGWLWPCEYVDEAPGRHTRRSSQLHARREPVQDRVRCEIWNSGRGGAGRSRDHVPGVPVKVEEHADTAEAAGRGSARQVKAGSRVFAS